jgi:TetR/AcrR family transcriptional repressor of nem operon
MGRASRADAAKHREEVVTATARLLRERGIAGTSVQDLMSSVGLTHGGFYKHFASKDELVGVATTAAFKELQSLLIRISEETPDRTRARSALFAAYLSLDHRDDPVSGCASAALAGDVARSPADSALRTSYQQGLEATLDLTSGFLDQEGSGEQRHSEAILILATMVGALTLARAAGESPLSEQILQVVRESLDEKR